MGVSSLQGQDSGLSQPWLASATCLGKEKMAIDQGCVWLCSAVPQLQFDGFWSKMKQQSGCDSPLWVCLPTRVVQEGDYTQSLLWQLPHAAKVLPFAISLLPQGQVWHPQVLKHFLYATYSQTLKQFFCQHNIQVVCFLSLNVLNAWYCLVSYVL